MLKRAWLYIKKLIRSNSPESSKRFLAIYTVLLLATYAVIRYTNSENLTTVLAELLGFVLALMGIASYQNILKDKNK
jgi:hypothetical protein|eukprot:COSAG06_NODE_526_length_14658_cov_21.228038_7_plen_77_part_00